MSGKTKRMTIDSYKPFIQSCCSPPKRGNESATITSRLHHINACFICVSLLMRKSNNPEKKGYINRAKPTCNCVGSKAHPPIASPLGPNTSQCTNKQPDKKTSTANAHLGNFLTPIA